jgi:HAD domain in Swiss Army Knife RNA repair proteins
MTRAAKPVWLLDVDGVVNALARGPVEGSWPADMWLRRVVSADIPNTGRMVLPILAAQPVLDFVTRVVTAGAADVVWHSTWRAAAVTDLAPVLGLPAIPISIAPEWTDRPAGLWWKVPAAERVVASGRPLVWTDDDIAALPEQVAQLAHRSDTLLVSPDPRTGLTPEHLNAIAEFIGLDPVTAAAGPRRSLLARLRRA